jgi:hypothetical protein
MSKITKRTVTTYTDEAGFQFTFKPVEDTITIKKIKAGYEARYLVQDNDAQSPDEWGDDGLFLVAYHRQFDVRRDEVITKDKAVALSRQDKEDEDYPQDIADKYHAFGLEAYIHSGVCLSLSNEGNFPDRQWDVSQLGLVLVSKKEWPDEKKARAAALSLIEEWNQYLSGDVYGIVKESYDKKKEQCDQESVWGFYGHKHALEALQTEI